MKFKSKLYASIGLILVLISVSVVILMNMLEQSMVNINVVVNNLYQRIEYATDIKYETGNVGRIFREMIDNQSNETETTLINDWDQSNLNIKQSLEYLEEMDTSKQTQDLIEKYEALHTSFQTIGQQTITMQKMNNGTKISQEILVDVKLARDRMSQISNLLIGLQEQELNNELIRSRDTYNWAVKMIYIYLGIAFSLGIGLVMWIIRGLTKNLNLVTNIMKSVNNQNLDNLPRIEISSKDEFGSIATAYNKMIMELEAHGKLEKQLLKQAEENSWIKTNIADLATMYGEAKDIKMLASFVISKLVPMVDASYGVFYHKTIANGEQYLKRIASYAYSETPEEDEHFAMGEGLVGQCALEKSIIYLQQAPNDYIKVRSGTGEGTPNQIIILPVLLEDELLSVIEIATFATFSSTQIQLLEELISTIGITIKGISNHMIAERLLQESQSLTEELQVQSEELQTQQEELRLTNEKLEEQYEASEQKKRELEEVKIALEEKAQQLEISSQYKSEFLANMSHELRTPLNSLLILAQILSENGEKNLTDKQIEYIRTIHNSGNDLLLLINDVLDLAKVESGNLEIVKKETELLQIQDHIMKQFTPMVNNKKLDFNIEIKSNVPQKFYTDEHRLQQILNNLISNAIKFTASGSVKLTIQKVIKESIIYEQAEGVSTQVMLAFSVVDTGIGIPMEKQRTIFDAFKQADGTTSRKYGGTGLGLSISREIAQLLGGFIELVSKVGEGSNFTLYLPLSQTDNPLQTDLYLEEVSATIVEEDSEEEHKDAGEKSELIEAEVSSLRHKKVLIVDDDIRNVYALTIALENYEMVIIAAENGREGIEMLNENPDTDLILMDIMMPEMDGFEAMRHIRKLPKYKTLPIIALTAKAMKKSREECLAAGATDYINKPIDIDQLFSLMNVWLYRKDVNP